MILSPVDWPMMAVAYLIGGCRKEAIYREIYHNEDVDETVSTREWKAFIKLIVKGDQTDASPQTNPLLEERHWSSGRMGGTDETQTEHQNLTLKQLTDAAMRAMRLQTIGEISARMGNHNMLFEDRIKLMTLAKSLVEDKTPPVAIDASGGVVIQMAPRRESVKEIDITPTKKVGKK